MTAALDELVAKYPVGAMPVDGRTASWVHLWASASSEVKNSGKEMAAASAPLISVSPAARSAAMANAMAMRWSAPESICGAVEALVAGNLEAVGILGELGSHGAEVLGDEGDAVGLLDAEFLGVADDEAVRGVGRDGGEHGQLVDDLGGERAADGEGRTRGVRPRLT